MYPTATDGNRENNRAFSSCSTEQIGQAISSKGSCFIPSESTLSCYRIRMITMVVIIIIIGVVLGFV